MESEDDIKTSACMIKYDIIQKYKESNFKLWSDCDFPDINGKSVKGSVLMNARDGCEIHRILGLAQIVCHCPEHNQKFLLRDEETGEPLSGIYYEIEDESGRVIKGETDKNGMSQMIHAKHEEKINIIIYSFKTNWNNDDLEALAINGLIPIKKVKDKTTPKAQNDPIVITVKIERVIEFSPDIIDNLSQKSKEIVKMDMRKSNVVAITITSTARTLRGQAIAMYNNCTRTGVAYQKSKYDITGKSVLEVYEQF